MPGVIEVSVNLASEMASVVYLEGATTPQALFSAAAKGGYLAKVMGSDAPQDNSARKEEEACALRRHTAIAAALALPVFLLEMGTHAIPALHDWIGHSIGHQTSWVLQFALTTAVLVGPGWRFYAKGFPALFCGAPDMNSLVALGTAAAWLFSVVATFAPGLLPEGTRAVYYEAAAVIVVLILLGRWMEARAKRAAPALQSTSC